MLSEEETGEGYYLDPQLAKEEDEIEAVLSHCRDEGREDETEDLWYDNVVCILFSATKSVSW
jgi:chromodomain-helicase-DNA-binding protein 1